MEKKEIQTVEIKTGLAGETTEQILLREADDTPHPNGVAVVVATTLAGLIPIVFMWCKTICALNHVPIDLNDPYVVGSCVLGVVSVLRFHLVTKKPKQD